MKRYIWFILLGILLCLIFVWSDAHAEGYDNQMYEVVRAHIDLVIPGVDWMSGNCKVADGRTHLFLYDTNGFLPTPVSPGQPIIDRDTDQRFIYDFPNGFNISQGDTSQFYVGCSENPSAYPNFALSDEYVVMGHYVENYVPTSTVTMMINPTQDLALGFFLLIFMFFGLLFYFKRRGGE